MVDSNNRLDTLRRAARSPDGAAILDAALGGPDAKLAATALLLALREGSTEGMAAAVARLPALVQNLGSTAVIGVLRTARLRDVPSPSGTDLESDAIDALRALAAEDTRVRGWVERSAAERGITLALAALAPLEAAAAQAGTAELHEAAAGIRRLFALTPGGMPPALAGLLDVADAEPDGLDNLVRTTLPELHALRSEVLALRTQALPEGHTMDEAVARRRLTELNAAWAAQDGSRIDALLAELDPAPRDTSGLQDRVKASLARSFSGISMKPLVRR